MTSLRPDSEAFMATMGRELFANATRLRVALLLAPEDPGTQFVAVEVASSLGLDDGAVLRELVGLAALGMIEPAARPDSAWALIEHPLWRIITATGDVQDELTRAAKGQRLRLVPPDRPPEPA